MKKKSLCTLMLVALFLMMSVAVFGQAPIKLWMNGKYVKTDVEPLIENERTLVPLRIISETLGYHVEWDQESQSVFIFTIKNGTVDKNGKTLGLKIGDKRVTILNPQDALERNNLIVELDVPAKIIHDRTFVPIRFIAEEFGLKVNWDNTNRTVVIGEGYQEPKQEVQPQPAKPEVKPTPKPVNKEYKNALVKAQQYANRMHMSKKRLYQQLTSEYGEKFSPEAAQYAIDNVKADWKQNALKKAKQYQERMNMSVERIRDQLVSEYGEMFTQAEANWAIEHLH